MWRKCIGMLGIIALAAILFTSSSYVFADAEDDTSGAIPDTTLYDKNGITIELIQFEGTIGIYDTDSESHLKQHLQVKMDDVLVPASSYRITGIPGVGAEGFHALSVDISSGNRLISCPISLEFIVNQIVSVEVDVGTGLTINSNTEYDDLKYELLTYIKIIRTDGSVISPTLDEFTIEGSLIAGVGDNPEPRTLKVFVTMGGVTKECSFNVDIVPIKPVSISVVDGPSYGLIANTDYIPETIRVKFEDNTTKDVMDFLNPNYKVIYSSSELGGLTDEELKKADLTNTGMLSVNDTWVKIVYEECGGTAYFGKDYTCRCSTENHRCT